MKTNTGSSNNTKFIEKFIRNSIGNEFSGPTPDWIEGVIKSLKKKYIDVNFESFLQALRNVFYDRLHEYFQIFDESVIKFTQNIWQQISSPMSYFAP